MSNEHDQEDGEGERDVVDGVEPFWKDQGILLTLFTQRPSEHCNKNQRVPYR
jgi:hypothetical protein